MIKVYLQKTLPVSARSKDYRGLTSLSTNIGPAELDKILMVTIADITEFYLSVHPEKTTEEVEIMVKRALNFVQANLDIQRAVR